MTCDLTRRIVVIVFVFLLHGVSATSSSTQSLVAKFYNATFLLSVSNLLKEYELSGNTESKDYFSLQYLSLLKHSSSNLSKTKLSQIESFSDLPYSVLFEDFIVGNRPFKSLSDSAVPHPLFLLSKFRNVTQDYEILSNTTMEIDEIINIPLIATNSFLRKLQSIDELSVLEDDVCDINYLKHWPSIKSVGNHDNATVFQCPSHMHTVLWGASQLVTVRLYNSVDNSPFEPISSVVRSDRKIPLHFPQYARHSQAQPHVHNTDSTQFVETTLFGQEFLFVPRDLIVSVHLSKTDGEYFGEIIHMCFVDASNFNSFREAIKLAALVSNHERVLNSFLSSSLMDKTMLRHPVELPMRAFYKSDSSSNRTGDSDFISAEARTVGNQRSDRRRRGNGNSDFKLWQETNNWNLLVSSLTLPPPHKLLVLAVGRNNVSVSWNSQFTPSSADQSYFGFRITYCVKSSDLFLSSEMSCSNVTVSASPALHSDKLLSTGFFSQTGPFSFTTVVVALSPDTSYVLAVSLLHDKTESGRSEWSSTIRTVPETAPTPPLTSCTSCISTDVTGPNARVRVQDGELQCVLQFGKPVDDGGRRISGFHVHARQILTDVGTASAWFSLGMFGITPETTCETALVVTNLVIGRTYQFKMSAYNDIGASAWTDPSENLHFVGGPFDGAPLLHTVYGRGHEKFLGAVLSRGEKMLDTMRVTLQLDFIQQTIRRSSSFQQPLAMWACHWGSGPLVLVHGEYLVVRSASEELQGLVGVVVRDGTSIAVKAKTVQDAGAIALVVVDVEGRCADFDQSCLPGAAKARNEGFAAADSPSQWQGIYIPVAFILRNAAEELFGNLSSQDQFGFHGDL